MTWPRLWGVRAGLGGGAVGRGDMGQGGRRGVGALGLLGRLSVGAAERGAAGRVLGEGWTGWRTEGGDGKPRLSGGADGAFARLETTLKRSRRRAAVAPHPSAPVRRGLGYAARLSAMRAAGPSASTETFQPEPVKLSEIATRLGEGVSLDDVERAAGAAVDGAVLCPLGNPHRRVFHPANGTGYAALGGWG